MKIPIPNFLRWYPIMSLVLLMTLLGSLHLLYISTRTEDRLPVTLTGVHHLGSDYLINTFYVDGYGGSNVGEGGGGGGRECCINLPKKWHPGLTAEVRWEVHHIIRNPETYRQESAEIEGMYRAQVPIEAYAEPSRFWVHFFPGGRVRIVVNPISVESNEHPIQWDDPHASRTAAVGRPVKALFTPAEIAESERETARDRAKYGDWR